MLVHPRRAAITSPTVGRARFGCLANETSYLFQLIFTQLETLPFLLAFFRANYYPKEDQGKQAKRSCKPISIDTLVD